MDNFLARLCHCKLLKSCFAVLWKAHKALLQIIVLREQNQGKFISATPWLVDFEDTRQNL